MCKNLHKHSSSFPITTLHHCSLKLCSFLLLLLFFPFYLPTSLSQSGTHRFIYAGCSQPKYQPNSPFQNNLNSLLSYLSSSASQSSYNSSVVGNDGSSPADATAYGLYQCRGDLSTADCAHCIESAVAQLGLVCINAYAAALQLDGCLVRYDNVNFLGQPDTTVVFKKCSPSTSNDYEFFRHRDDVLADLQAGIGFRVKSVGMVEGVAQCIGDLNSGDCTACLSAAIEKLKNVCGAALAADVYLAQCYSRYWASGYYSSTSTDSPNEDDVGKTVAIIVGVLAGVALVVVFLSFLRKAFGKLSLSLSLYTRL